MAIVYETGDAASEREARDIERAVSGMTVGKLAFSAKRVPTGALDQLAGARMAFVTQGANSRQVAAATAARSILSVSFDRACIRAGFCVLAVSETPRVQIIVSKAATSAAKLRFDSSFLMLVKEN